MKGLGIIACVVLLFGSYSHAEDALNKLYGMSSSAIVLVDADHHEIISKQADVGLIPASTVKLITALVAMEHWGRNHRFKTQFYLDRERDVLLVKGLGDPFLISEELDVIVDEIKRLGINHLNGITSDDSHFTSQINFRDQGNTNNPYDAAASALAVNFNTIEVNVTSSGIESAESQTPLTPMASKLAKGLPVGKHRINLGSAKRGPNYFIEVLSAKLRQAGITVNKINDGYQTTVQDAVLLFTHANTRSLAEVVAAMLEYSNNFIANQLFLLLGSERYGAPANLHKAQQVLTEYISQRFSWDNYQIEDGAGLSRSNLLSANQLLDVLTMLEPYRDLMPIQSPRILAKSGTMKGVSCYAGFLYRNDEWHRFAVLINQPVEYRFREKLAKQLLAYDG